MDERNPGVQFAQQGEEGGGGCGGGGGGGGGGACLLPGGLSKALQDPGWLGVLDQVEEGEEERQDLLSPDSLMTNLGLRLVYLLRNWETNNQM